VTELLMARTGSESSVSGAWDRPMARATSTFQPQDYGQPASGEWQELRGELVALLDQVETQVARTARPAPS